MIERRESGGNGGREAMCILKRRLSDASFKASEQTTSSPFRRRLTEE
jgi:hypothetical protein